MDPKNFKAPFIPREKIWKIADAFRTEHWGSDNVPIDIYRIVEFRLKMEYRFTHSLRATADTDALLLGDLKTIVVDRDDFLDDRYQNRLRFSLAHEIGHLVLHSDSFSHIEHSTVDEWVRFIQLIPESEYAWMEFQAYEFAGRLLVPLNQLKKRFVQALALAEEKGFTQWDSSGESALDYISQHIAPIFEVSPIVINKRLTREKLWPPKT